jgi:hypothetical protein
MKRRALLAAAALVGTAYVAFGATVRARRAPRPDPPAGEARGAYHVHTTRSDGRGTLDDVVRAAREAGLQFVVIADHETLAPGEQGWRGGVLVVEATEVSTSFGHVVALGVPRALSREERDRDPLRAIADLGGHAVIAHPFHPRRPFTGWARGPWRGFELVSNDTAWFEVVTRGEWGKAALAALVLPWDGGRAVLDVGDDLADERSRFDAELRAARGAGGGSPARVLLCSADAHGYPSYVSAFSAFSMHVPVALSGDGAADARAVVSALADGRAACVFDGVAPASGVALAAVSAAGGRAIELSLAAPDLSRAAFTLLRDGVRVATARPAPGAGPAKVRFDCGGTCAPGDYRVEGVWDGRPWIFTNPMSIE